MIRTLTEPECLALTVRGDVPGVLAPGVLVEMDWTESDGETEETRRVSGVVVANCSDEHGDARVLWYSMDPRIGLDNRAALFLRVPVAGNEAHLVGWLGRGERCAEPDHLTMAARGRECVVCDGTGYRRPRRNCYAWLTPEALGGLPDWIRLALIWGSVARVAAGMGALVGYAPAAGDQAFDAHRRRVANYALTDTNGRVIRFEAPDAP